ncbi:DoxX family protein [soil metagenome]
MVEDNKEKSDAIARLLFGSLMVAVGVTHLVSPHWFVSIMPSYLPTPEALVFISGVAEIAGGLGLVYAPTRKAAGWGLVALLVCVLPANVNMALNPGGIPAGLLWMRILFQPVLIWVALKVSRT